MQQDKGSNTKYYTIKGKYFKYIQGFVGVSE